MLTDAGDQTVAVACPAMGTRFELLLRGGDGARLRAAGEAACEEIVRWHGLLSAFDASSVVSRINRGDGEWVRCPDEVLGLLCLCREVWSASGGAFDPAVGGLMRLAGFRDDTRDEAGLFAEARGWAAGVCPIEIDSSGGRCRVVRGRIDLGGAGKGWALDRAAEVLREHGVKQAFVHGGTSSAIALGGPWRVEVDVHEQDVHPLVVELCDAAIGVSHCRGRMIRGGDDGAVQGGLHGHVLDPLTGESVDLAGSGFVTGPSAALCDAWSTAMLVRPGLTGEAGWPKGYVGSVNGVRASGAAGTAGARVCMTSEPMCSRSL